MEILKFKEKLIDSFIGNVVMFALNLIFPAVISRLYGVEIFGSYIYGITIVSIALYAANLGMDMGLLYFVPKSGEKYVSSAFAVNVITSGLTVIVLYCLLPDKLHPYLGLVWLLSAEQLFFSLYRSRHHIKDYFLIKSLVGIVGIIIVSYLMYLLNGPHEMNIVIAAYIAAILSNIIYAFQNKFMFSTFEMHTEFVYYSLTVIIGGVMSLMINYIDIVMIKSMISVRAVGLYKVASELALMPSIFLRIVNTIFPPMVSKLYHEGDVEAVRKLYEKLTRYLFLISTVIIGFILLFADQILNLYGIQYLEAKHVLIYRAIGQLVNASVGSVWYIVMMTGHQKIRLISIFISALLNISLNYILIPVMGIDGAALASMTSTVFINILGFFVVKLILKSKVYYFV